MIGYWPVSAGEPPFAILPGLAGRPGCQEAVAGPEAAEV